MARYPTPPCMACCAAIGIVELVSPCLQLLLFLPYVFLKIDKGSLRGRVNRENCFACNFLLAYRFALLKQVKVLYATRDTR